MKRSSGTMAFQGEVTAAPHLLLQGLGYISFGLQTTAKSVKILPVAPWFALHIGGDMGLDHADAPQASITIKIQKWVTPQDPGQPFSVFPMLKNTVFHFYTYPTVGCKLFQSTALLAPQITERVGPGWASCKKMTHVC